MIMAVSLDAEQRRAVEAHAVASYPDECCGFLLGVDGETRVVTQVRQAENIEGTSRSRRFTIDPKDILRVERELRGTETLLLGFYHSHPDHPAVPSATDTERAWPWYTYIIHSVRGGKPGEVRAWRLDEGERVFKEEAIVSLKPVEGRRSHG